MSMMQSVWGLDPTLYPFRRITGVRIEANLGGRRVLVNDVYQLLEQDEVIL
jgi:hypothetical protein